MEIQDDHSPLRSQEGSLALAVARFAAEGRKARPHPTGPRPCRVPVSHSLRSGSITTGSTIMEMSSRGMKYVPISLPFSGSVPRSKGSKDGWIDLGPIVLGDAIDRVDLEPLQFDGPHVGE